MSDELTLWYRKPAGSDWTAALPIGNGNLGAMVFGGMGGVRLPLNEETIWGRNPGTAQNPAALEYLPKVRELLFAGKPQLAQFAAEAGMMADPNRIQPYQPLGFLEMTCPNEARGDADSYRRQLSLRDGIARVRFSARGRKFTHEYFASAVDQCIVMRITGENHGVKFIAELHRTVDATTHGVAEDVIGLTGQVGAHGTKFHALARVMPEGGHLKVVGNKAVVEDADAATLIITCGTDFYGQDPQQVARQRLDTACKKSVDALREDHLADHRALFDRVSLNIGKDDPAVSKLATDERLARVKQGAQDPGLEVLYFQFGRYLMMGSSRPGGLPANLQGIWNDSMTPPWESDYHININLQMNYWPAGLANLSECQEPLFEWMKTLAEDGRKTAKIHYGCPGWVAHHISNPWGVSGPIAYADCGLWPTGGAWLCDHIWEHYLFTQDRDFLASAYPLLRDASRFFLDFLVEDEKGRLLCGPSLSPENRYRLPDGTRGELCMGPTMDNQILRELFTHTLEAGAVLGMQDQIRTEIEAALPRLPKNEIGPDGRLLEWADPLDEPEPGHRHISHVWGLYPGTQITPERTPELAEACRKTVAYRLSHGGGHTGWSAAWLTNIYARLHDADKAYDMLLKLLRKSTLTNLFDSHPPFQIDGNFGGAAAIGEMLLQSTFDPATNRGVIHLLPATPDSWDRGDMNGFVARGGVEVAMTWSQHKLTNATLTAPRAIAVEVRLRGESLWSGELEPQKPRTISA